MYLSGPQNFPHCSFSVFGISLQSLGAAYAGMPSYVQVLPRRFLIRKLWSIEIFGACNWTLKIVNGGDEGREKNSCLLFDMYASDIWSAFFYKSAVCPTAS